MRWNDWHCSCCWSEDWTSKSGQKRERQRNAQRHTSGYYLSCETHKIGLEMSHSSGTNLSVLSGVLRRLPTMLCCSVATPSVGVKFSHKTSARERMAAYYSHLVLMFPSQRLMDNITLSSDSCLAAVIMLYYPSLSICSDSDYKSKGYNADMYCAYKYDKGIKEAHSSFSTTVCIHKKQSVF